MHRPRCLHPVLTVCPVLPSCPSLAGPPLSSPRRPCFERRLFLSSGNRLVKVITLIIHRLRYTFSPFSMSRALARPTSSTHSSAAFLLRPVRPSVYAIFLSLSFFLFVPFTARGLHVRRARSTNRKFRLGCIRCKMGLNVMRGYMHNLYHRGGKRG